MSKDLTAAERKAAKELTGKGRRCKWHYRCGSMKSGFHYKTSDDKKIKKKAELERIKSLVIPPAWSFVRISPSKRTAVQAVGIDMAGRLQYIYNPTYAARKQKEKFAKMEKFGEFLPEIRRVTNEHLDDKGLTKEKVLAVMMRLVNSLYIRLGSEKSAKEFKTYGITTLKNKHLTIGKKGKLTFEFVGKSHVKHRRILVDESIASILRKLKNTGNARKLFHYIDENGKPKAISPADLNRYIKEITGPGFSSKDFRTWGGTLIAAAEFARLGAADDKAALKKNIVNVVRSVAEQLGNTPAVCRGSYIHPKVIKCYEKGITLDEFHPKRKRAIKGRSEKADPEESALIKLLKNNRV